MMSDENNVGLELSGIAGRLEALSDLAEERGESDLSQRIQEQADDVNDAALELL